MYIYTYISFFLSFLLIEINFSSYFVDFFFIFLEIHTGIKDNEVLATCFGYEVLAACFGWRRMTRKFSDIESGIRSRIGQRYMKIGQAQKKFHQAAIANIISSVDIA